MRLCGGVAAVGSGGVAGITVLAGRGDSNCSGDIALEPGRVDSIFFPGRVAGCRKLIAISCSVSLMTSGSSGCRDSNVASGRSYRWKDLLSVLRMVPEVFPCGRRGSGIHHHAASPMPMPPAPLGLLPFGGAGRIHILRFRNKLIREVTPAGGEVTPLAVEKLLRLPVVRKDSFAAPASG